MNVWIGLGQGWITDSCNCKFLEFSTTGLFFKKFSKIKTNNKFMPPCITVLVALVKDLLDPTPLPNPLISCG
jgi:hypothetical protein